jgi:glyoxylase-like metal-dependent hydrolase (beta-lactamase superfamily II)
MQILDTDIYWYSKDKPVRQFCARGFSSNVYIIKNGSELWQIDAGTLHLGRGKRQLKWMKQEELDPQRLSKVFFTHSHGDHITGITYFKTILNPQIYIHELDQIDFESSLWQIVEEQIRIARENGAGGVANIPKSVLHAAIKYSMGDYPQIKADHLVHDGDIIKGEKYNIKVIHSPGHTEGHCCYYIPELKALFLGDLIDPDFNSKPPLNLPSSDYDQFYTSIQKLLRLDVEYFCMPHAKQVYQGIEANRKIIQKALDNLDFAKQHTIELLKQAGDKGLIIKDFKGKFPKSIWNEMTDAMTVGYSVIKSLKKQGKIRQEGFRFYYID